MPSEVPNGWSRATVDDVVHDCYSGGSPTCEERHIVEGEWGLLKTTAITWERGWDESAHKVAPEELWGKESQAVAVGDVLITKAGPRHRVGVVAHVDSLSIPLLVSGKMIGLRPRRDRVVPRVLAAALSERRAQVFLNERTTGMAEAQVNFTNKNLLLTPLALPPIPEQKKIAAILSSVDEAIQATQAVIEQTRRVKEGLLQDLLTRGIGHTRFKQTEIGEIPEGWEVVRLNEVSLRITKGATPTTYGHAYVPGETRGAVRFLRGVNATLDGRLDDADTRHISSEADEMLERSRLEAGDCVFSIVGNVGCSFSVSAEALPANISQNVALIRPDPAHLSTRFLAAFLQSSFVQNVVRNEATVQAQPSLSLRQVGQFRCPLPRLEEQAVIGIRVEGVSSLILSYERTVDELRRVKGGLLQDLLTGKTRVSV